MVSLIMFDIELGKAEKKKKTIHDAVGRAFSTKLRLISPVPALEYIVQDRTPACNKSESLHTAPPRPVAHTGKD